MAKGVEEKLAFPKQQARLHELAQRKSRILNVQNGSRRGVDVSKAVILHEGSLRTLWAEKAQKNVDAKQVGMRKAYCCALSSSALHCAVHSAISAPEPADSPAYMLGCIANLESVTALASGHVPGVGHAY